MMIGRGRCGVATVPRIHTVAGVVCGVGGVHGAVATRSMHLQSSVFALLGDGVHLGEENRGDQHSSYDYNTDSVGGVVEMNGSKVVYDGPSCEHRNYANSSTGHPSTFIVVSFDSEHRHPVESGENEQEAGVHVEEEEGLLGHITLGVDVGSADLERHVDDEPLGGDDHLHHDHEEERQKLIDLWYGASKSHGH